MIRVAGLRKAYDTVEALRGISFEIPDGQICGYLGPNGAGKSTTVRILTGTLAPTEGRAEIGGHDVVTDSLEAKKLVGYVPEVANMYDVLSVEEFLTLVGNLRAMEPGEIVARGESLLKAFEIPDAIGMRIETLSKGMRQKVALISALLHDPKVLLLDEPLSGLDANVAAVVKECVAEFASRGKTVLYCSHMLDVVERLCPRVIILAKGQIVAEGSPSELCQLHRLMSLEEVFRHVTGSSSSAREITDATAR